MGGREELGSDASDAAAMEILNRQLFGYHSSCSAACSALLLVGIHSLLFTTNNCKIFRNYFQKGVMCVCICSSSW